MPSAECRIVSRPDPEAVKCDGWHDQGILVVSIEDVRLSWPEVEWVRQLGTKLYGQRRDPA